MTFNQFDGHCLKLMINNSVPPFLHMYFISVVDWASTFPSGVTKKGIWPNGGRPAGKKQKLNNHYYLPKANYSKDNFCSHHVTNSAHSPSPHHANHRKTENFPGGSDVS